MSKSIHMICGKCGCDDELRFEIDLIGNCDNQGVEYPAVFIKCDNCGELTGLDNVIHEDRK